MAASKQICTTSELQMQQSIRTSTVLSTLLKKQGWTFLLAFSHMSLATTSRLCSVCLKRTLTHKFEIPFLMKRTLGWMLASISSTFRTLSLLECETCWLVFLSCKTFSCRGPSSQGRSRTLTIGFLLLFWIVVWCTQSPLFVFSFTLRLLLDCLS